jgi:hypothetical protein
LRCLLFWPRVLRHLRKVWSWYFQTSSSDEKKTEADTGGASSSGTLRKHEECGVVCASRDFGGGGEPSLHSISGSSDAEQSIQLEDGIRQTPSVPRTLSSSYTPSQQGSPRLSPTWSPSGSRHASATSLRAESPHGGIGLFDRSNTPVRWTHSRATGRQFTRASSRSRSRPSSPFLHHLSRPNTPMRHNIDISIQHAQGFPEGSTSGVSILLEEPSRPASPEDKQSMDSSSRPQLSPVHGRTQSLPTRHQHPSIESLNSSAVSSHSREHSPSTYGVNISAHPSRGTIQDSMTSQSIQAQAPRPPFTFPFFPRPSTQISTANNALSSPFSLSTRVRPMNSDQVSRYVKKGDV